MTKRILETKKRGSKIRKSKSVYLVIAEGNNKTETLYLSNFQQQGTDFNLRFVKAGNNTDVESLYKNLVSKWDENGLDASRGDKGFVIIDIDNDPDKALKVQRTMQLNDNSNIYFIVSNPTFEIWFFLHFKYTTKYFPDGNAVIKDLKKYIPDYEKNKDCFILCKNKMDDAICNAEKLTEYYEGKIWPSSECNPRTDVGKLIKLLIVED